MINPEERKELIILLKIMQDEEKWRKIFAYAMSVIKEEDERDYPRVVREPEVSYGIAHRYDEWMTEEEAQEVLEDYEARKGISKYSQTEMESWVQIVEHCKAHPEDCHTAEEVLSSMRAVYA